MTPDFDEKHQRAERRMNEIDNLPSDVRALIHEYGYNVVNAFMLLGIKKPRHIKHLVETVLNDFSPTRGSYARQGIRTPVDTVPSRVVANLEDLVRKYAK